MCHNTTSAEAHLLGFLKVARCEQLVFCNKKTPKVPLRVPSFMSVSGKKREIDPIQVCSHEKLRNFLIEAMSQMMAKKSETREPATSIDSSEDAFIPV